MRKTKIVFVAMALWLPALATWTETAEAAEGRSDWVTPISASVDAGREGAATIRADTLRGVSDDGSTVLMVENAYWQVGQSFEVAVEGRATNYRLADLLGEDRLQSADGALSGNGRYAAVLIPRLVGGSLDGFEVARWEPAAGRYEVLVEVPSGINFYSHKIWITTDGRYVFYYHPVASNEGALTRVDAVTKATRTISFEGGEPFTDFTDVSADGRYVIYVAWNESAQAEQVRRKSVATGSESVLFNLTDGHLERGLNVALSPTGRYAAFAGVWHDTSTGATLDFTTSEVGGYDRRRPVLSIDRAGVVAFITESALVAHDINNASDAYAWYPDTGRHQLISISDMGTVLEGATTSLLIAGNGGEAVFETFGQAHRTERASSGAFAGALFHRSLSADPEDSGVVAGALRPGGGFWTVRRTGVVTPIENQTFLIDGQTTRPVLQPGEEVTSMSATASGEGYWLFTSLGRVLNLGDAPHLGDLIGIDLAGPIVDSKATPSGNGYYMVGADGGVFAFGDAAFYGSIPQVLGSTPLAAPVVALAVTPSNRGYRMVAADGGVFNFGDAEYFGSVPEVLPGVQLQGPVVGLVSAPNGYLNVASDGGIFNFGQSPFHGSLGANPPPVDVSTVLVLDELSGYDETGYIMIDRNGTAYGFGSGQALT